MPLPRPLKRAPARRVSCYATASAAAALGHRGVVHKRGSGAKTARPSRRRCSAGRLGPGESGLPPRATAISAYSRKPLCRVHRSAKAQKRACTKARVPSPRGLPETGTTRAAARAFHLTAGHPADSEMPVTTMSIAGLARTTANPSAMSAGMRPNRSFLGSWRKSGPVTNGG
jgi:hypothetical protein